MFKTTKLAAALASIAGVLISAPASAVIVNLDALGGGSASISIDILDMGTTTYGFGGPLPCGSASNALGDVAACDANSGGSVGDAWVASEDTWSIFRVSKISVGTGLGNKTWNAGVGGDYLTGMFHSSLDYYVTTDGVSYTARATGGLMDIYRWNSDVDLGAFANGPGSRTGASSYVSYNPDTSVNFQTGTLANLWLQLAADDFQSVFSCVGTDPSCPTVNATTTAFLSVIDGAAMGNFDTNTVKDTFKDPTDPFRSDFSLSGSPLCTDGPTTCSEWTTVGNLTALGYRIPEPGSLALMGLGLFGLGSLRRRKTA